MEMAQKKVRSWCEECEAWHPLGKHVAEPRMQDTELRAEPRPIPTPAGAPRGSGLLRLALFVFVIVPVGIVAWSAAVYAVLLLWPHIRTAFA